MKTFRAIVYASLGVFGSARADVRTIWPIQHLSPPNTSYYYFGQDVAVDGHKIIVMGAYEGGQAALLYQRANSDSPFTLRRVLQSLAGPFVTAEVAMKNGIAAVRIGNQVTIYEYSGGDYVRGRTAAPLSHPGGLAISGNAVLVGGNDCDYDAVVYQKNAAGTWGITGRLDDNQGQCYPEGVAVELHYTHALVHAPLTHDATAWHRHGTALDWHPFDTLSTPPEEGVTDEPFALQNTTGVAPGGFVFQRSGNNWARTGRVVSVTFDSSPGIGGLDVVYRDGVLMATESVVETSLYVYVETSPGQFEHLAVLNTSEGAMHHDHSGRTVVAAVQDFGATRFGVDIFTLPNELRAPSPIVNDFEDRDISGFTFDGGRFALARRGLDDVLTQSHANGLAIALLNDSNWSGYQRVEAEITPNFGTAGSWVGLVAQYVDANNYFFATIRGDGTYGIYRRLNGAATLLREGPYLSSNPLEAALIVDGANITLVVSNQWNTVQVPGLTLKYGRAGFATSQARADFDQIRATTTEELGLLIKEYDAFGSSYGRNFTELGGEWTLLQDDEGNPAGYAQLSPNGSATATIGTPVPNQEITARMRLDSFNSSFTTGWFGILARYVDSGTHYYVAVRSTNVVQIRKKVNGGNTVLAAANFTAQPGQYHDFRFRVINDQLQLFIDDALVASAHDDAITKGQYGIGTYMSRATWQNVYVVQP